MKFFVVGLGNFGATLSVQLTGMGHEVIGADINMNKIEALKDRITHTVCMDCTDINNLNTIPLREMDVVVVAIGEDFAASVLVTALMKQMKVKKLLGRAFDDLHRTVIEALGVDELLLPEQDSAEKVAKRLTIPQLVNSYEICDQSAMMELRIPQQFYYQRLSETGLTRSASLKVVAYVHVDDKKNLLGYSRKVKKLELNVAPDKELQPGDHLILIGNVKELQRIIAK
ncbi:TrkA family potassium uptake protein [Rhabdobacter roseus]|uniref:Trk system potassium uptake protein TrkA n=1 Tax=Rhabdobacter roseus TaxID=1655419 RepID=A0A840TK07_9BACT|nr:TrkA family potassium uptake protein [Rhabdobacter roseus]MBB5283771.1 trk system potassium uptake protein TrkA [Rhabdobacter roseus]